MIPALARRGKLILATGALYATVGAVIGSAPLAVLGGLTLCALMAAYLVFFPSAIMLRRRKFELSWWIVRDGAGDAAICAGKPFLLRIALRNHSGRRLRVGALEILSSSAIDAPEGLEAAVPGRFHVEISGAAVAHAAGHHMLHGAVLKLADTLGLFELSAYFPNPLAIKALPRQPSTAANAALRLVAGPLTERAGGHTSRRRGIAGELRELRERQSGDPFKLIAWKATARTRRLMVRDMETEIVLTHHLLVDIGASMRHGPPGARKLDAAIDLAATIARTATLAGDRVALTTYDSRVCATQPAASGTRAYTRLVDRLTETHHVVDEDLTDVTDGELCACVARYLAHQEAIDVRVKAAPALDSPDWEMIQAGPEGELYDLRLLRRTVRALLAKGHHANNPQPSGDYLRRFCQARGIELPYRETAPRGARSRGFADAISRACEGGRGQRLVILTDLDRVDERPQIIDGALARARHAGHRVVAIAPMARILASPAQTRAQAVLIAALDVDARRRVETAQQFFARRGVPVAIAEPDMSSAAIAAQLGRGRNLARVA